MTLQKYGVLKEDMADGCRDMIKSTHDDSERQHIIKSAAVAGISQEDLNKKDENDE